MRRTGLEPIDEQVPRLRKGDDEKGLTYSVLVLEQELRSKTCDVSNSSVGW